MDDADRLHVTKLFVAAVQAELGARGGGRQGDLSAPLDPGAFASAVEQLGPGNKIASEFPALPTISGPLCPDFQQGMAVAQSAGLISRLNPSFQRFTINLSKRQVSILEADDSRFGDAQLLAKKYLALTLGCSEGDDSESDAVA